MNKESQTKQCDKCKEYKTIECFSKATKRKDGLQRSCKSCNKQYREENKDKIRIWNKEYRVQNKEKLSAHQKQYRIDNYEKVTAKERKYHYDNKEHRNLKKREYYQNNKDIIHAKMRVKYKTDKTFKLRSNISSAIKRAFLALGVRKNKRSTFDLLGYSLDTLQNHLQQYIDKPCERCEETIVQYNNSNIDHVIPLSLATTEQDVLDLSHYTNLRLICPTCNQSKNRLLSFDNAQVNPKLYDKFVKPKLKDVNE